MRRRSISGKPERRSEGCLAHKLWEGCARACGIATLLSHHRHWRRFRAALQADGIELPPFEPETGAPARRAA